MEEGHMKLIDMDIQPLSGDDGGSPYEPRKLRTEEGHMKGIDMDIQPLSYDDGGTPYEPRQFKRSSSVADNLLKEKAKDDRANMKNGSFVTNGSGSGGQGRDDDRSALLVRALTRPLSQAPPLDGLREAISSPLLAPLPLFTFRLTSFNAVGHAELLEAFFELESVSESSAYSLAAYLETIISKDWPVSGSEHDIAKAVSLLVGGLLNWLEASRGGNVLCMSDSSNSGGVPGYVDGSSIEGLHCDYQVWLGVQQALLFKGEERAREQDMLAAIGHLGADLASLSKMWSGQAEYVLCYVAAGTFLQFFALVKEQGRLMEMTEVHNCGTVQGRLRAVHNVINIYRVLASQIEQLKGANAT